MAFKLRIYTSKNEFYAVDDAPTEPEARESAVRWTSGRGQKTWTAYVVRVSDGVRVAKYKGGKEAWTQ